MAVQGWGVCLPWQLARLSPWSRNTPRASGQLNPCATAAEAHAPRAHALHQQKPREEKAAHGKEEQLPTCPPIATRESLQQRRPNAAKEKECREHMQNPPLLSSWRLCCSIVNVQLTVKDTCCCMTKCHLRTVSIAHCLNRNFIF